MLQCAVKYQMECKNNWITVK